MSYSVVTLTNAAYPTAPISVAANGNFTVSPNVLMGSNYNIVVAAQPYGQSCAVTQGGTGTAQSNAPYTVRVVCAPLNYHAYGTVVGLLGGGNVSLALGTETQTVVSPNSTFGFSTNIPYGSVYTVSLTQQPVGQTCVATAGNWHATMGNGNLTNLVLTCVAKPYSLGGTVTGLVSNTQVGLQVNANTLQVSNGNFVFPQSLAYNANYTIAITNPNGQNCQFANNANVYTARVGAQNILLPVTCLPATYTLGGQVSGLLANTNVTLQNGADVVTVGNGNFVFAVPVPYGSTYTATVPVSPVGQNCTFSNASNTGVMGASNNANVMLVCTPAPIPVVANVTGLVGNTNVGVQVGGVTQQVSNGNTVLNTPVSYNSNYTVTLQNPNSQTCLLGNGNATTTGLAGIQNIVVRVNCTPNSYSLGGTVSGLLSNTNVAIHHGADTVTSANGSFTFPTPVAYGSSYTVSIASPAGQTCSLLSGQFSGTMGPSNSTAIAIVCAAQAYSVGGSVTGLTSNTNVTLTNGADTLLTGNGNYQFPTPVVPTANFNVMLTSPVAQTCSFANPNTHAATMGNSNVSNVNIVCTTAYFSIGGTVSGLMFNANVTLANSGNTVIVGNGPYAFPSGYVYGANYNVTVASPPGQTCTLNGSGTGTLGNANIVTMNVSCQLNTYVLAGTITGLAANTNVQLTNGNNNDTLTAVNGAFAFSQGVVFHGAYSIAIAKPVGQKCWFAVGNANVGTMGAANTNIAINCNLMLNFTTNQSAYLVIGAPNFTTNNPNHLITATSVFRPIGTPYQAPTGTTYFSDAGSYRSVVYASPPSTNGQAATGFLAQASGTSAVGWTPSSATASQGLMTSFSGDNNMLFVNDFYDNRVLVYAGYPTNNTAATWVMGQSATTGTNAAACSQTGMNAPYGVFAKSPYVVVGDTSNNRVLIYNSFPSSSGVNANVVLGQPDFTTCTTPSTTTAATLHGPRGVWTDGNRLLVCDTLTHRVLYWQAMPTTNQQPADFVIGQQGNFLTSSALGGGNGTNGPQGVTSDGNVLWVASAWNRIEQWPFPTVATPAPTVSVVLGQSSTLAGTANQCNCTTPGANTLNFPTGVGIMGTSLVVTDYFNDRYLLFASQ